MVIATIDEHHTYAVVNILVLRMERNAAVHMYMCVCVHVCRLTEVGYFPHKPDLTQTHWDFVVHPPAHEAGKGGYKASATQYAAVSDASAISVGWSNAAVAVLMVLVMCVTGAVCYTLGRKQQQRAQYTPIATMNDNAL